MKDTTQRSRLAAIGLVAAGVVAGAVLAVGGSASADSGTPSPAPSSSTQSGPANPDANGQSGQHGPANPDANGQHRPDGDHGPDGHRGPGGPNGGRPDEKPVTDATQKATLTAAAEKAVPGGTVDRVESDAGDAEFEVHMTKADGTRVTVKFDKDLSVTGVEDGMGTGDPQLPPPPQGAPGQAPQGGGA